jgi:excisionase family DNA binding protein
MGTDRATDQSAASSALEPLIDIPTLARCLAVSERHVRRLVSEGRIPYLKAGRFVRFRPSEIEAWLRASRPAQWRSTGS